jgi:23S rRNA-/tRNA-specific pseudouridylate synthase
MESLGRAAAAAGSPAMSAVTITITTTRRRLLSTSTSTSSGTSLLPPGALHCHVLYVDRGVIVLNKPPGLVSQAIAPSHDALPTTRTRRARAAAVLDAAISGKNVHRRQMTAPPPQSAVFDDVLYGESQL